MPDDNGSNPVNAVAPSLPTVAAGVGAPSDGGGIGGGVSAGAPTDAGAVSPVVVPVNPAAAAAPGAGATGAAEKKPVDNTEIIAEVVRKIGESTNVLIALSSDPSVDEMAAAIGLSLYLDKLGKRATAIYSGQTPNALEFLKPEETFESSVDTLQDFVIALNKDKADHLRYKLDGEFVKIYITPYKTRIAQEDLEFSYGDFNVDLVLALDVANGIDLDDALREHGRIMHDAVIVDITTGNPGKLGEIEWSDKSASSVSEMIAKMLYSINGKAKVEKEEATAFLTGIVAATNRFSNANTTPETMQTASKLMRSGANQQLVSKNITPDIENEMLSLGSGPALGTTKVDGDPTKLDIQHGNEEGVDESKVVDDTVTEKESTLLDDLKAAEASLAAAGAEVVADENTGPVKMDSGMGPDDGGSEVSGDDGDAGGDDSADGGAGFDGGVPGVDNTPEPGAVEDRPVLAPADGGVEPSSVDAAADGATDEPVSDSSAAAAAEPAADSSAATEPAGDEKTEAEKPEEGFVGEKQEKVLQPSSDFGASLGDDMGGGFSNSLGADGEATNKYGQMLEDALESVGAGTPMVVGAAPEPSMTGAPGVGVMDGAVGASGISGVSGSAEPPAAPEMGMTSPGLPPIVDSSGTVITPSDAGVAGAAMTGENPAAAGAPSVAANPEINGVPEINYMPMPGDAVLPPPPTPPIADAGAVPPVAESAAVNEPAVGGDAGLEAVPALTLPGMGQPAASEPVAAGAETPADPGAFKIPGVG